jgi:hypothetical protein
MARIVAEVDAAQESIDFAIFFFTHDALRNALIRAHERGVRVRGLWDASGAGDPNSDDEALCVGGLAIKVEETAGKMHNKWMVIDAGGAAPRVVTGSLNWTISGSEANNENTLVIQEGALAQRYADEFQRMWQFMQDAPCNAERPPGSERLWLPLVQNRDLPEPPARVTRIVYNPPGDDLVGENVVVENRGATALQLQGWTLEDAVPQRYTFPAFLLPEGSSIRVWVKAGTNTASDLYWGKKQPIWNNDGDTATLRDPAGSVMWTCSYDGGGSSTDCGQ